MSWENVDISTVKPAMEVIPLGTYTFQLLSGKYDATKPGKVLASAAIVTDGEQQGRKLTFSYPDPEEYKWSPAVFARLRIALGVDALPNEDPVTYLNRASGNRFVADVKHRTYKVNGSDEEQKAADLDIFNPKPAA